MHTHLQPRRSVNAPPKTGAIAGAIYTTKTINILDRKRYGKGHTSGTAVYTPKNPALSEGAAISAIIPAPGPSCVNTSYNSSGNKTY